MIRGTMEQIDELIALKRKQIELLNELRASLDLAARAGVDPNQIEKAGYDPATDMRWKKWPSHWTSCMGTPSNYVILKDGTRRDAPIDWETRIREDRERRKKLEDERANRGR